MESSLHLGNRTRAACTRCTLLFWLGLLLLGYFSPAVASEATAAFEQANKLYEQGKFTEAAAAYEQILTTGRTSPALLFNLGNARFKAGQLGHAIASFHRALQLAPRDSDIQANLAFARAAAHDGPPGPRPSWSSLRVLTANEVALLAMACLWIWLGSLTAMQFRPAWRGRLHRLAWITGTPAVLLGLGLATSVWWRATRVPVVVTAREAVVRLGPFEESQSAFVLRDGAEVVATHRKADWLQVRDAAGRTGWVRRELLAEL